MWKFGSSWGDSPSVIHSDLKTSQRETPVSLRTVQRWCKALEKGYFLRTRRDIALDGLWRPRQRRNILRVKKLLKKNPEQSVREVSSDLPSHKQQFTGSSRFIWNSGTFFSYGCPINLSDNDKRRRVECCQDILSMFNSKAMSFIASHYVVEDESWFVWDQKERRNAWIEKKQTRPTVARARITKRKTMLLVAITCKPKTLLTNLITPRTCS